MFNRHPIIKEPWQRYLLMADGDGDGGGGSGDGAGTGDGGSGDGAGDGDGGSGAASTAWPEDWRGQMSGGDEKFASHLERFTDPAAVGKSFQEARTRITAGDLLKPLPAEASDEDIAAFREQQGIPKEAAAYMENLPDGLVIGENDKAAFESFSEAMHAANVPPATVHSAMAWYNDLLDKEQASIQELDVTDKQSFEDEMRQEWGGDYRANINVVNSLLDAHFPAEVGEMLKNGRGADGRALFNNQDFMRGLVSVGRLVNPLSTVLPAGEDNAKGLADEKAEIEKFMKEHNAEYIKDEKMQARYRDLIQAELNAKERSQAA